MRGGLIIWNADKLARLYEAIQDARNIGGDVLFSDVARHRVVAQRPTHTWSLQEAEGIYRQNLAALDGAIVRTWPENREGPEP